MKNFEGVERTARAICIHLRLDKDEADAYVNAAVICATYLKSRGEEELKMSAQLIDDSPSQDVLVAMLNHTKLLIYGSKIEMPPEVKNSYFAILYAHIVMTSSVFYSHGYSDSQGNTPSSFNNFISDLDFNDV